MTEAPPALPTGPVRVVPVAAIVLISVLAMLMASTSTAHPTDRRATDADDPVAVDLIQRSAAAPRTVSYSGTQYVSEWSSLDPTAASASAVMTLEHQAGRSTTIGVPNQQSAILEWRDRASWLAGGGGSAELLLSAYDVVLTGSGAVAGRPTLVVEARRDDGSVAARLWLDVETSLTLRRETFDDDGALLNASAFVDIEITAAESAAADDDRSGSSSSLTRRAGAGDTSSSSALTWSDIEALRDTGWHCPDELSDGLKLYEAHRYGDVIHLSYSDGVMTVSVFEQPGRLDHQSLKGYGTVDTDGGEVFAAPGPPARYTWSSGDQVLTVVSEAPASVLDDITTIMPPDVTTASPKPDDGIVARIVRGAKKVGSFLNPFD